MVHRRPSFLRQLTLFIGWALLQAVFVSPSLSAPPELNQAKQLIEEGRLAEAHTLLQSVLTQDPSANEARLELARLLTKLKRSEEAIHEYERLVALDPQNRDLQLELAWTLTNASRFKQAVAIYDRLLQENPAAIDIHLRKAMALYGTGDLRSAIREYRTILELDPSNIEAEVGLKELEALLPSPFHLIIGATLTAIALIVLIGLVLVVYRWTRPSPFHPSEAAASKWQEDYIHFVAIVSLIVATYYLVWRLTSTMNWEAWWFSIPVFLAEAYGVAVAYMFFFMVWRPAHRTPPPPPPNRTVDVFITTYNEDPFILRKTILGCRSITYPHATYVLDDGNRPEVAQLARELGCEYVAREKNVHAKAGNLNNALRRTSGEFIVTMDADHVPLPHFVDRLLGYFTDPAVAFVQTPQDYYNVDSYQHHVDNKRRRMWTEQSLFFAVIQPGKDRLNSAFYCGSCAMIRRSALEAIGGFAEATVTEDIHTSLLLHAKGFKSVYHNESLAYGLAPATAVPFHVQRLRWGQGAMQVLARDNPLWLKGLTLSQRISYFASMTTYLDGFQKLIFYSAPVVYFATGILPIIAFDVVFLLHFVPYFCLFLLSFELMSRGCGATVLTEQYNMAKFATFMKTTLGLVTKKRLKFRVTPKSHGQPEADFNLLYPQILVLAFNVIGVGVGTFRYVWKGDLETLAYAGNLLWAFLNSGLAAVMIRMTRRKIQQRSGYRFPYLLPCSFYLKEEPVLSRIGFIRDCHEAGASLVTSKQIPQGSAVHLWISLGNRVIAVEGAITNSAREATQGATLFRHGIRFTKIAQEDQHYLIRYSFEFAIPKFMKTYNRPQTVFDQVEGYIRQEQRRKKRLVLSLPTVIRHRSQNRFREILAVTDDLGEGSLSVLCPQEIAASGKVTFTIHLSDKPIQGEGTLVRGEKISFGTFQMYRYVIQFQPVGAGSEDTLKQLDSLLHSVQAG
jgi:cellulose synthase (UDP-forming)